MSVYDLPFCDVCGMPYKNGKPTCDCESRLAQDNQIRVPRTQLQPTPTLYGEDAEAVLRQIWSKTRPTCDCVSRLAQDDRDDEAVAEQIAHFER